MNNISSLKQEINWLQSSINLEDYFEQVTSKKYRIKISLNTWR